MQKNSAGEVLNLYISIKEHKQRHDYDEISVDTQGVIGDKFYSKDLDRAILITSQESYDLARSKGVEITTGSLGENILIDYNPYHLRPGDRLKIGEVLLEITQNCTLCKSLAKVNTKLPKLLKDDRGIFAKAITIGTIKKGDIMHLIQT
jgi:MOSC domain-containing protein YiiM